MGQAFSQYGAKDFYPELLDEKSVLQPFEGEGRVKRTHLFSYQEEVGVPLSSPGYLIDSSLVREGLDLRPRYMPCIQEVEFLQVD